MVYRFETLREHTELNQYFLNKKLDRKVSMAYALKDLLTDPLKVSSLFDSGFEFPKKLIRCDKCGSIYTHNWELVANPDNASDKEPYETTFGDINIDLYYHHEGGELEHVKKRIVLSGTECATCLSENPVLRERSMVLAEKDPDRWRKLFSRVFPEHEKIIPDYV